jgi:phosphoglycolate phosphatase-like HAD superfamily hydrolase
VPDPAAVVVVGDTLSDLEAGARAGAGAVIGVLTGAHSRATLLTGPHTELIDDITQLIRLLSTSETPG